MRIDVTQEDIDNGIPGDCENCPVALSTKRIFYVSSVRVYVYSMSINDVIYPLPPDATELITSYDAALPVTPISFELEVGI